MKLKYILACLYLAIIVPLSELSFAQKNSASTAPNSNKDKECVQGFYRNKSFADAQDECIKKHKGTELSYNNGNCQCNIGGANLLCDDTSEFPKQSVDSARKACESKPGILFFGEGACRCQTYAAKATCQMGESTGLSIREAFLKCTKDGDSLFSYDGKAQCTCQESDCSYEVKEFSKIGPVCETYNSGKLDEETKRYAAQITEMETKVCEEVTRKVDATQLKKLIEQNPDCLQLQKEIPVNGQESTLNVNFSVGEGEHKVNCSTKVSSSVGDFKVDNIGAAFPNNIITLETTPKNFQDLGGETPVKVVDTEIIHFRKSTDGKTKDIPRNEYKTMQDTYLNIKDILSQEIARSLKEVDAYLVKIKNPKDDANKAKNKEIAAINQYLDTLEFSINVSSFASLLNTNTFNKVSNLNLAQKRYDRTIQMLKNIVQEELTNQVTAALGADYVSLINANKIVVVRKTKTKNYGTFGPIVPTSNYAGMSQEWKNAKAEGRFAECGDLNITDKSVASAAFECSLKSFIVNDCQILDAATQKNIFPECLERDVFVVNDAGKTRVIENEFQRLFNDPSTSIGKLKIAFNETQAQAFYKYKYFSVQGNLSFILHTTESVPLAMDQSFKTKELLCEINLTKEDFPTVLNAKMGYKAHIKYLDKYSCQDSMMTVATQAYRYLKIPHGWMRRNFKDERCAESERRAKQHYRDFFGDNWEKHWKADSKNYDKLGGDDAVRSDQFKAMNVKSIGGIHYVYNSNFDKISPIPKFSKPSAMDKIEIFDNINEITTSLEFKGEALDGFPAISIHLDDLKMEGSLEIKNVEYQTPKIFQKINSTIKALGKKDEKTGGLYGIVVVCYLEDHFLLEGNSMYGNKLKAKRKLFYRQKYIDENGKPQERQGEIVEGLSLKDNTCDGGPRSGNRTNACRVFKLKAK